MLTNFFYCDTFETSKIRENIKKGEFDMYTEMMAVLFLGWLSSVVSAVKSVASTVVK